MNTVNYKYNIKTILTIIISAFIIIISQWKLEFHTHIAANGSAKIYIIELIILIWGIYVILINTIHKSIVKQSKLFKLNLALFFIFGIYYCLTMLYHLYKHMPLTTSFYLARIMLEICCTAIIICFYKLRTKDIFLGILTALLFGIIMQYITLIMGKDLRGAHVNILGDSVTMYTCQILLIPYMVFFFQHPFNKFIKPLISITLIAMWPTLILAGSRLALILAIVIFILSCIFFTNKKASSLLIISTFITLITSFFIIKNYGNNNNNDDLQRSVYEITRFLPKKNNSIKKTHNKNVNKNVSRTVNTSNDMRKIINKKSIKLILKNKTSLLFGIGMSSVYTKRWGYQKPHNLFLLFLLPFGIIGLFICYSILLSPLLIIIFNKNKVNKRITILIVLTLLPLLLISTIEPTLGVLIIDILLISLTSCLEEDKSLSSIHSSNMT